VQDLARVLLVTRARMARRDLIEGLPALGWTVAVVDRPSAAIDYATKHALESVIIDLTKSGPTALIEAAALGRQLKAAASPKSLMVIAMAAACPEQPLEGLDHVMPAPIVPIQMASRLDALARLATAEDEIALRAETFAALSNSMPKSSVTAGPYRVLIMAEPAPQVLALYNELSGRGAEVSASFNHHAGFDSLSRTRPDAVVLRADPGLDKAMTLAAAVRRNSAHYHLPISLILTDEADPSPIEAMSKGMSDLIASDRSHAQIADQVLESARLFRRIDKAQATLVNSTRSELMDAATGLFTARLFASHVLGLNKSARRTHRPLSVCVLRVADRKDTAKARASGALDKAMPDLGNMVGRLVRGQDTVARLAPDVFALALPATNAARARLAADRVAAVIGCTQFPAGYNQPHFTVGFDIGVAELSAGETAGMALERAANLALQRRAS